MTVDVLLVSPCKYLCSTMAEDIHELFFDEERMNKRAHKRTWYAVMDLVGHKRSLLHNLKTVNMLPEPIGSPYLDIRKLLRRSVVHDSALPRHLDP